jgi:hypothetical protein
MTVPRGPGWSLSGTMYSEKYSVVPTSRYSVYATDWTSGIGDSQQGKTHRSDWLWCRTISVYNVLTGIFPRGKIGRGAKLTIQLYLVLKLEMCGATIRFLHTSAEFDAY